MSTRVWVQVECEVDPSINVRIDRQTALPLVDAGDELMRVGLPGRMGISAALRLAHVELTAFALGPGHRPALQHALAAGAHEAVELQWGETIADEDLLDGLERWVADGRPDLVIGDRWTGLLAARLGWAHLAGLTDLAVDGNRLRAVRAYGRGVVEKVTATLPALVRLQTDAGPLRYVARARVAQAAKKTISCQSISVKLPERERLVEAGPLQVMRPRTRLGAQPAAISAEKASDRLNALMGIGGRAPAKAVAKPPEVRTTAQMAEEFVRYLAHHQLLAPEQNAGTRKQGQSPA